MTTGKDQPQILPLVCIRDCKSMFEAVYLSKHVAVKRLRIELSGIKELIENGKIHNIQWLETKTKLAYCLTKKGASPMELRKVLQQGTL